MSGTRLVYPQTTTTTWKKKTQRKVSTYLISLSLRSVRSIWNFLLPWIKSLFLFQNFKICNNNTLSFLALTRFENKKCFEILISFTLWSPIRSLRCRSDHLYICWSFSIVMVAHVYFVIARAPIAVRSMRRLKRKVPSVILSLECSGKLGKNLTREHFYDQRKWKKEWKAQFVTKKHRDLFSVTINVMETRS